MSDIVKQVIVMRNDLGMRKGKMIAQGSHASISFLTRKIQAGRKMNEVESQWVNDRFTKICVRVDSEQELIDIHFRFISLKVRYRGSKPIGFLNCLTTPVFTL